MSAEQNKVSNFLFQKFSQSRLESFKTVHNSSLEKARDKLINEREADLFVTVVKLYFEAGKSEKAMTELNQVLKTLLDKGEGSIASLLLKSLPKETINLLKKEFATSTEISRVNNFNLIKAVASFRSGPTTAGAEIVKGRFNAIVKKHGRAEAVRQFVQIPKSDRILLENNGFTLPSNNKLLQLAIQGFDKAEPLLGQQNLTQKKAADKLINDSLFLFNHVISDIPDKASYADLQTLRAARRALVRLDKRLGKTVLQSGKTLEKMTTPLHATLKTGIDKLLKTKNVAASIIAERLLARRKGRQTRNAMVTTGQMLPLLQNRLLGVDPSAMKDIARALCRQINEMMESPDKYKGKSLQLKTMEKSYPFYSFDHQRTEQLNLGFPCWLEMSKDGKEVDLFIIPPNQTQLGKGTYKKVSKGQGFKIPFKVERAQAQTTPGIVKYDRNGQYSHKVLLEAIGSVEEIDRGIAIQKRIQALAPQAELPSLPQKPSPLTTGSEALSSSAQYSQDWYNSDLSKAVKTGRVPLDLSEPPQQRAITTSDSLGIIIDVGASLTEWHRVGIVHRDMKPPNILLRVSEDGTTVKGLPADYDLAQEVGLGITAAYEYWDTLSNQGLATPFTDVWGLAVTLGEAIIPGFSWNTPKALLTKQQRDAFLLQAIKSLLTVPSDQRGLSDAEKIQEIKTLLATTISTAQEPSKGQFKAVQAKINAIEGAMTLIAEVVEINKNLAQTISMKPDPVWESVKGQRNLSSTDKRNAVVAEEIQTIFNQRDSTFNARVASRVSNWASLTDLQRIQKTKEQIRVDLANISVDSIIKEELKGILAKIESRESALTFMAMMAGLPEEQQTKHPLYLALQRPTDMDSQETIDRFIDEQITKISIPPESPFRERAKAAIRGLDSVVAQREAIKAMLQSAIDNSDELSIVKTQFAEILDKITMTEKGMAYAVEIRDTYKKKAAEVMNQAMTMNTFVTRVKAIQSAYNAS